VDVLSSKWIFNDYAIVIRAGCHAFGIDFMYGDSGIGYLSARAGRWYLYFECC
jgi:hypothetical protein